MIARSSPGRLSGRRPPAVACGLAGGSAIVLMLSALGGCADGSAERVAARTGRVAAPDGVPIVYDDRGAGPTTLVFVHCWACDRQFWREQVEVFAAERRVIAVDLPGHGEAGVDRESWSIETLGDDVVALIEELDLRRVILVGHSMGGPVALFAAERLPERVIGIVAVDTLHDAELEFPAVMVETMAAGFELDFEAAMESAVRGMLGERADPELTAWVVERACAANHAAAVGLMRSFVDVDLAERMGVAGVPIRAINAMPTSAFQPETRIEVNRRYADYDAVLLDGVGHFLLLEAPERFNPLLADAIRQIEALNPR